MLIVIVSEAVCERRVRYSTVEPVSMDGMANNFRRLGINRVTLPILLLVSCTAKIIFSPSSLARLRLRSRETASAVPFRVSPLILHTQDESKCIEICP